MTCDIMGGSCREEGAAMTIQNRVDPFGQLQAVSARGLFMGNRGGRFHDPATKALARRQWTSKNWIICVCAFGGRKREVWGIQTNGKPGYTEVFFLDDVTALAAGHRPCFECRHVAAKGYARALGQALGVDRPRAAMMDDMLHRERFVVTGTAPVISLEAAATLPDGTMIASGGTAYAIRAAHALPWSFDGYGVPVDVAALAGPLTLLTPPSTVAALAARFQPVWHPSAG